MLVTYAQAEVPLALLTGNSDVRHWRYAELSFCSIWLFASTGYIRSGQTRQSTLLMPELREFEQLLDDCGDHLWIEDVMVVSPDHINGSGGWLMERLTELEEAVDERSGQLSYIYTVQSGTKYIEGSFSENSTLETLRSIYKSK